MSVTITITDPTVQEANALRTYLDALHGSAGKWHSGYTSTEQHDKEMMEELHAPAPTEWVGKRIAMHAAGASIDLAKGTITVEVDEPVTSAEDAGAPDFDSSGLPWDERIHASSRATISDGTWKKKRGVTAEEVAAVEAELRNRLESIRDNMVAPGPIVIGNDDAPEVPEAPVPEPVATPDAPSPEPTVPVTESAPTPVASTSEPSPVPAPPVDTANPFLAVMSRIGKSGMTKEQKDELLTAAGALDDKGNPSILVLNKKPELIAGFDMGLTVTLDGGNVPELLTAIGALGPDGKPSLLPLAENAELMEAFKNVAGV